MNKISYLRFIAFFILLCSYEASAMAQIRASRAIPTTKTIVADMVGRRLSEGTENGYFYPEWRWTVEEGEIIEIKILSKNISSDCCSFVVDLILKARSCPTKYKAIVTVDYYLENNNWKLMVAKSNSISIVKTGKYLDCINTKLTEESFGRPKPLLQIKNNIDSRLIVGGIYRPCGSAEWKRFSKKVDGLSYDLVGMLLEGVDEYRIEFVELD